MSASPESLSQLEQLADLGLPLGQTRFRALKRVVVRLCWVFLHRQIDYNHQLARSLDAATADMRRTADGLLEETRKADQLRNQIGEDIEQLKAGSVRHGEAVGALQEQLRDDLGAIREELVRASQTLSAEQVRSGVLEGQGAELSRSLLEIERRVTGLSERLTRTGAVVGRQSQERDGS